MSDQTEDINRAAGAMLKTQGAAGARQICDTQIAAADRYGDLEGHTRWNQIKQAIDDLTTRPRVDPG